MARSLAVVGWEAEEQYNADDPEEDSDGDRNCGDDVARSDEVACGSAPSGVTGKFGAPVP